MPARTVIRRKIIEWTRRYLPAEVSGTVAAVSVAWAVLHVSDSLAFAAVCGAAAENIAYYGVICSRKVAAYWRQYRVSAFPRRCYGTAYRTVKDIAIEFGTAELVDSLWVRPGLFYIVPQLLDSRSFWAFLLAKLLADVVFYTFAITSYEFLQYRKKRAVAVVVKDVS